MSDALAIRLTNAGKMYKLFDSRFDNFLEAVGAGDVLPWHRVKYREFWALRGIDLVLPPGGRVGVIGRNGAGKTTLLKLITRNLPPTEGDVEVNGEVQALLEAGAGFHPDFTGYENIRAALVYQGLTTDRISAAIEEIAEFTELGDFLGQPLKTYSAGMQARLAFATATVVDPKILVVDEILGAGDAYFLGKSAERMKQLVSDGGATILLVSHSMLQITQICERAIWLERGQIVMEGPALEVVKSYERHIRSLEDRRLRAKNARRRAGVSRSIELEAPEATFVVRVGAPAEEGARCDVARATLTAASEEIDTLRVGAPQDANTTHSAFVILDGSAWSSPADEARRFYRSVQGRADARNGAGAVAFNVLTLAEKHDLRLALEYRLSGSSPVRVEGVLGDHELSLGMLEPSVEWSQAAFAIPTNPADTHDSDVEGRAGTNGSSAISRWPGEGSLRIARAEIVDERGDPTAVLEPGSTFCVRVAVDATRGGTFRVLPVAVIYRLDGLNVTSQIDEWITLKVQEGDVREFELVLPQLNLGNGNYVVSIALYKNFDPHLLEDTVAYDWLDRSLEFKVVGMPPAITSVFIHSSTWTVR